MAENGDKPQMTDLEAKICQQIEFYFGDHNLPRDRFLKEQISLDDGWVSLKTMITFNRLSKLSTDFDKIFEALKKSKTGLLELDEENCKIRRCPDKPLPEGTAAYKNSIKKRSLYIKGFPTDTSLDDIKEWLDSHATVENIQMRRTLQKTFKGSVFVVFDTEESLTTFLEKKVLKFKDSDLLMLLKEDYFIKKNEERKQHKTDHKATKAKQDNEAAQKEAENAEMKSLEENTGCLLKFSGGLDELTSREDIHALFQSHAEIKWIDFSRGAKEGIILFRSNAKEALDKAKSANKDSLQLKGKAVNWEVLEGEVEMEALRKIREDQKESFNKRRNKGGRKFKGKGKGGRGNDNSSKRVQFQGKKKKFDSSDEDGDMEDADSEKETDAKNGTEGTGSSKKRALDETKSEEPVLKQAKTEGAGDQ